MLTSILLPFPPPLTPAWLFYFQIKYDIFLEDLNSLLNSGDIPNLFDSAEQALIRV